MSLKPHAEATRCGIGELISHFVQSFSLSLRSRGILCGGEVTPYTAQCDAITRGAEQRQLLLQLAWKDAVATESRINLHINDQWR